ncbi:PaaI family thioesterase [Conexibacter sp. SYSU D00693]|uniref:PaaI family thioesterase n=1 Tax=Conexibacter sp. SYSU D00693 TaxID=2812560 RepID=UPI00196AC843|nr:PaaI family thioesterase [Conexibacter sp. SYSU D00693]
MSVDSDGADDGKVGPFSALLGFKLVEARPERVVLEATPGPEHANGGGIVHGGYLTALLDSASGWAVHTNVEPEVRAPHTHLSVQYVRAALVGRPLRCTGTCVRAGGRVAAAEAEVVDPERGVIARAVTTHALLR